MGSGPRPQERQTNRAEVHMERPRDSGKIQGAGRRSKQLGKIAI